MPVLAQTSQPPAPREADTSQQQPAQTKPNTGNPKPVAEAPVPQITIPQPLLVNVQALPPNQQPKDEWKTTREWGMLASNAVLIVITGVLALYAAKQWRANYIAANAATDGANAANISAHAASASAQAAKDSLSLYREHQRAWLSVEGTVARTKVNHYTKRRKAKVTFRIRNRGGIPARDVKLTFYSGIGYMDDDGIPIEPVTTEPRRVNQSLPDIVPQGQYPFVHEMINEIQDHGFFVKGTIAYMNGFGSADTQFSIVFWADSIYYTSSGNRVT